MTNDCRRPARAANRQQVIRAMNTSRDRNIIEIGVLGYISGTTVATVCKQARAYEHKCQERA